MFGLDSGSLCFEFGGELLVFGLDSGSLCFEFGGELFMFSCDLGASIHDALFELLDFLSIGSELLSALFKRGSFCFQSALELSELCGFIAQFGALCIEVLAQAFEFGSFNLHGAVEGLFAGLCFGNQCRTCQRGAFAFDSGAPFVDFVLSLCQLRAVVVDFGPSGLYLGRELVELIACLFDSGQLRALIRLRPLDLAT